MTELVSQATQATQATDEGLQFSLLSWNVWFGELEFELRFQYIFSFVAQHRFDVICFQEVTPEFVYFLKDQPWLLDYACSDNLSGSSVAPYGVLTLCKKQLLPNFRVVELPTSMFRKLLLTEISFSRGGSFCVGNVHLESLDSSRQRLRQLTISKDSLKPYDSSILCGDFNFCSYRNFDTKLVPLENDNMKTVLDEYIDVWPTLVERAPAPPAVDPFATPPKQSRSQSSIPNIVDDSLGFTFDTERNAMLSGHRLERMRYDRIMLRSACAHSEAGVTSITPHWKPVSIRRVGMEPIDPAIPTVYPSDHFGLVTTFALESI